MKKITLISASLLFVMLLIQACSKKEATSSYTPTPYSLKIPNYFPAPVIPDFNPMTDEGVSLGRMLYYDPILSSNGLSCSSCHNPDYSFSTPLFTSATGTKTSVPPHINLAWSSDYLWDGSKPDIESVCIEDFDPPFFNTNMDDLVEQLKNHNQYPQMFYKAFGITDVSAISHDELKQKIVYAISQFIRTMVSSNSKFDKTATHQATLTQSEMNGYYIFMTEKGDCFHCHGTILFTTNQIKNNGLDSVPTGADLGRYLVTGDPNDIGKFSIPTLRNVELTAPYMHDGRFQTLEEVVEFYNSGVCQNSPNIDPIMTKPAKKYGLQLTSVEKEDLINFLKTLTDTSFVHNPDYAKPF